MNEARSSRYHRTRRRIAAAEILFTGVLLTALCASGGSARLRDAAYDSTLAYVGLLAILNAIVTLPCAWYRGYRLERLYALSRLSILEWFGDYAKTTALNVAVAVLASQIVVWTMRMSDEWWWLITAAAVTIFLAVVTMLGPVFILPLFYRSRPLGQDRLQRRLVDLSARAGVPVLTVHEWNLGGKTRRVNAALVGAGATRRILLSDTLLAGYTEDEIEVVMAHEIGHHVHGDVMKGLAAEFLTLVVALYAGHVALNALWTPFGFRSAHDPAALPVILLAGGIVSLGASPLLNAWSRRNERRADQFALKVTARPDAFIAAMRRMAAQNMAEERPTLAARWFFNTHPGVEERIVEARCANERSE